MPLSSPARAATRWLAVAFCVLLVAGPPAGLRAQQESEAEPPLARGWRALQEGSVEEAARLATQVLSSTDRAVTSTEEANEAQLLRAAALYSQGALEASADVVRQIESIDELMGSIDPEVLPGGFRAWARGTARGGDLIAAAEVSLDELSEGAEVREVASHFTMDVEIVRIPVIVEDKGGDFITGLERDDFRVLDGGPPPRSVYQLIREDEPASVGVLIDASAAARDDTPSILQAVTVLLDQLRQEDEVFLLQFGDEPQFLSDFTGAGEQLLPAVAAYRPGGDRALRDAVATGLIRMRDATHDKRSLVVVALGGDAGSRAGVEEVRRAAQREGVSIYVMLLPGGLSRWRPGQDDSPPTHLLQRLAFETGGLVALRPPTAERYGGVAEWIHEAATDIGAYIKHQYLLQYESVDPPPRGQWRDLRVRVDVPHGQTRARSGYVR